MAENFYQPPASELRLDGDPPRQYAGFWVRAVAALVDTVLLMAVTIPLLLLVFGSGFWSGEEALNGTWNVLLNYVFPALVVILFWVFKSATPGKLLFNLAIIDAKTGGKPSVGQLIGRYFAYYLAILPLLLGFIWVAWDKRKQGWHDKLAGTVVIKRGRYPMTAASE